MPRSIITWLRGELQNGTTNCQNLPPVHRNSVQVSTALGLPCTFLRPHWRNLRSAKSPMTSVRQSIEESPFRCHGMPLSWIEALKRTAAHQKNSPYWVVATVGIVAMAFQQKSHGNFVLMTCLQKHYSRSKQWQLYHHHPNNLTEATHVLTHAKSFPSTQGTKQDHFKQLFPLMCHMLRGMLKVETMEML